MPHVAAQELVHACVDVAVGVPLVAHQIAHDLAVGLAVEPVVGRPGGAEHLAQGGVDRAPADAVGPEHGAIDVEEDELHRLSAPERVRRSPVMMLTAPTPCQSVSDSPRASQATTRAMRGCKLPNIAVRVGPITLTPRYQKR